MTPGFPVWTEPRFIHFIPTFSGTAAAFSISGNTLPPTKKRKKKEI